MIKYEKVESSKKLLKVVWKSMNKYESTDKKNENLWKIIILLLIN